MPRRPRLLMCLAIGLTVAYVADAAYVASAQGATNVHTTAETADTGDVLPATDLVASAHIVAPIQGTPLDACWDAYGGNQCQVTSLVSCGAWVHPVRGQEGVLLFGWRALSDSPATDGSVDEALQSATGEFGMGFPTLPPFSFNILPVDCPSGTDVTCEQAVDQFYAGGEGTPAIRSGLVRCIRDQTGSLSAIVCDAVGSNVYEQIDNWTEFQSILAQIIFDFTGLSEWPQWFLDP